MERRQDQLQHALQRQMDELSRRQLETNRAVDALFSGKLGDVKHVLSAMQRADDAFQSLLAVREELNDSGESSRSMPMQA